MRRRLAQKVEFLVLDTVQRAEPEEADLRLVYETRRERFQSPARIRFTHVYFSRDRRGARAEADARAALRQLSQPGAAAGASDLGDRFLAQYGFVDADEEAVASVLGQEFAARVFALAPGGWRGPIESGYGLHRVRVASKQSARPREFAAVKGEVLDPWRQQREQEWSEQYFAALLKEYDVVVDESIKPRLGPLAATGSAAPPPRAGWGGARRWSRAPSGTGTRRPPAGRRRRRRRRRTPPPAPAPPGTAPASGP